MQIHGYNHHFNRFGKNPFSGEAFRVFMAVEDDSNAESVSSAPEQSSSSTVESTESDLVKEIRALSQNAEGHSPFDTEEKWQKLMGVHSDVTNYMDWVQKMENKVGSADPSQENWKSGIKDVHKGLKKILNYQGQLKNLRMPISPEYVASIESVMREEFDGHKRNFVEDMQKIRKGLKEVADHAEKLIKEEMKKDMQARLQEIESKWRKNPPAAYQREPLVLNQLIGTIKKMKNPLASMSTQVSEDNFKDYKAFWQDIDFYEDLYEGKKEIDDYHTRFAEKNEGQTLDVEALERKLKKVENLRKERVKEINAVYTQGVASTKQMLTALRARIEAARDEEIQDKKGAFEKIDEQLASLAQTPDFDVITKKALYYEPPSDPKDPDHKKSKGLAHQIADLKNATDINATQKEALLVFLDQALDKFENDLNADPLGNLHIIQDQVQKMNEAMDEPAPNGSQWTLSWVAPYDAVRGFEIIRDWGARKLKRHSSKRIGTFGSKALAGLSKLTGPLSSLNTLPNEFDKEQENAEQEEVNAYKEAYKNKDMWQIEAIAYSTRNQDELKACLKLLAENGRLRWDRRELLKQFNRFQSVVHFSDDIGQHLGNISVFYKKLNKACGTIWDFDTFKDFKNTNSSAYESKKNGWQESCNEWGETVGLNVIIEGYLQDYKEAKATGRNPTFDPLAYEKIIDYSIKQGKMGSEQKMYYLIQGIAWGILPPDRGSALNAAYLTECPGLEYFGSKTERGKRPNLEDIQEVAALSYDAYRIWFDNKVMKKLPQAGQRLNKSLTQGNSMDHDDLLAYLAYMGVQTTKNILKSQASGFSLPQTGVLNGTVSMVNYLDGIAFNHDELKKEGIDTEAQLVRFIGSFVAYDGILKNRMFEGDRNYFRVDGEILDQVPRGADSYKFLSGREGMTVRENLETVETYLKELDPDFFGFLFDNTQKDVPGLVNRLFEKHKEALQALNPGKIVTARDLFGGTDVKNVDDLHEKTTDYVSFLIKSGKGNVQRMLGKIQADRAENFSKFRKELDAAKETTTRSATYAEMRSARGLQSGATKASKLNPQFLSKKPDRAELQAIAAKMQGGSGF